MDIGLPSNRKEWGFLIAIIVLLEFIFLHFVYTASDNKELVNLFSFGATLISIILALIAIFYSFLQTEAQKEDSRLLASQLQSLANVSERLSDSSARVDSSTIYMKSYAESLGNISGEVSQSRQGIEDISKKIDEIANQKTNQKKPTESTKDIETTRLNMLKELLPTSLNLVKLLTYAAYLAHKKNLNMSLTQLAKTHFAEPMSESDALDANPAVRAFNVGTGIGIILVISKLGINIKKNEKITFSEDTKAFLDDFFKDGVPDNDSSTIALAKAIEKSFTE